MEHDPRFCMRLLRMNPEDKTDGGILVIGPSWIGDMVMAQSLFITLERLNPLTPIDVLAPGWSLPLLQRMPQVSLAMEMPVGHGTLALGKRRALGHALRLRRYRRAIVLPNSFKSALIPWFADIPLRTGWRGEMRYGLLNDPRRLDKRKYPLLVQRFNALAYPRGEDPPPDPPAPRLQSNPRKTHALLKKFSLAPPGAQGRILALCPGAEFGPAKRWPEHHYAAVARAMIREDWRVWLMGSERDRGIAENIVDQLTGEEQARCKVLAGNTTLEQAIDLLALADAVISNDSGLMHVAAALRRPLIVVYGSTSPEFTPPLHGEAVIVSHPTDCGPCFRRECPRRDPECLEGIFPERVLQALRSVTGES
uniref:lipopolysaccharide heptosyltransferase II n=1 Tax=Candidatus Kentrum sp. DK TaxID=2126562 RepID=A0A450SH63_9GAMM|nr:MAG: heptosyltransferase-2 [Candidatus Kentron sp. DK]